jgi:PAS domain S-box-containing protein
MPLPLPAPPPGSVSEAPAVPAPSELADALMASEARFERAQRLARLGYWEWSAATGRLTCSVGLSELLGAANHRETLSLRQILRFVHGDDRARLQWTLRHGLSHGVVERLDHRIVRADGVERFVHQELETIVDAQGRVARIIGVVQDITDQRLAEQRIRYLVYVDATTGLPNRSFFNELVRFTIDGARRYNRVFALLCLDLDNFCRINDSLGHQAGDQVLGEVARRLRGCVRHSDRIFYGAAEDGTPAAGALHANVVTRLGGDEFVVILSQMNTADDGARAARRIEEVLTKPFTVGGTDVTITGSVGISIYPSDGTDAETLLKSADAAMHHAKACGGNGHQFFTASLNQRLQRKFTLETGLRKAITNRELALVYQPKVDIQQNRIVGMEALLRWHSPEFGMVPPLEFIAVAEETGLIMPIGDWVIREACRQAVAWQAAGLAPVSMSVNLSAAQFRKPGLVKRIACILDETRLDPRRLDLELTESLLMDDTDSTIHTLKELTAIGLSISIDDFGTGYSSLAYLRRFPISTLKIDQSFVRDITANADAAAIVNATIALAHTLRLRVVAEGVEEEGQLDLLRKRGCDQAQGFLFSRPSPPETMARWLQARESQMHSRILSPIQAFG